MNIDLSVVKVPKGKTVQFIGLGLDNDEFPLEEDPVLRWTNTYEQLVSIDTNKIFTLIGGAVNSFLQRDLVPAGFKQLGFQQWAGTKPISFRCAIALHVEKFGARQDVVERAVKIMKMAAPSAGSLGQLYAPGPSAIAVFLKNNSYATRGQLTIRFGAMTLHSCIIKSVEPTFSQETDTTGAPIWCKLNIECETLYTANSDMIDELFGADPLQIPQVDTLKQNALNNSN